jgi:alanine racemase
MGRAATATINFDALRHNYRLAKQASNGSKAVAIVKADAYGHGAIMVARALANEADAFGVACIEEAIELRDAGIKNPILLLEGFFTEDELSIISERNLWTAIHSVEQIKVLSRQRLSKPINVWLKMDTGMHRLGIQPEDYEAAYTALKHLPQVSNVVLMTHFSCADEIINIETASQISIFNNVTKNIVAEKSLANSAGTLGHKGSHGDWQRPGIMLYGATPFSHSHKWGDQLKSVMTLTSEVIAIHNLVKGQSVGYSKTFVCEQPTKVGTVAIGYADGYPRHAKPGTPVMVNGQRTIILGRVSMDMLAVDLTNIDNVTVGAEVELWGDKLKASDIAMYCDTITYTLFTGITRRVHKVYKNIINRNSPDAKNSEDAPIPMSVKIVGTVAS